MFEYLELTDGVDSAVLTDHARYDLVSYGPAVAPLRDGLLGDGPYEDVQDTLVFHAAGCTAAEAYQNAGLVNYLLDQARRWMRGETVSPVKLRMQVQGSGNLLEAIVKGRREGGPPNVGLEVAHTPNDERYVSQNLSLQFARRGQLLLAADETATAVAAANPSVLTATFASSHRVLSPADVRFTGFGAQATPFTLPPAFLLIASAANRILFVEAETMTATGFTSVADAANNARGGSVLRYTPTGTAAASSGTAGGLGSVGSARQLGIFAAVRNNSASVSWQITPVVTFSGGQARGITTAIGAGSTAPQIVPLGIVSLPLSSSLLLALEISASSISGSPTLDIDYLCLINLDDPTSRVIALPTQTVRGTGAIGNLSLSIESQALTAPAPRVVTGDGLGGAPGALSRSGDAFLSSIGATLAGAVLMTGSPSALTSWRYTNGGVVSVGLTATRRHAFVVPE